MDAVVNLIRKAGLSYGGVRTADSQLGSWSDDGLPPNDGPLATMPTENWIRLPTGGEQPLAIEASVVPERERRQA